jgi:ABC-2 type transport system ATP-binding protein
MNAIAANDLTLYYGKFIGVKDISLQVQEGEKFGFIGPNGAGKTTTIRLLLNILFPSSGSGTILGHDMVKDSVNIKKITGYLPAESNFYSKMTVEDFINYNSGFYDQKIDRSKIAKLTNAFDLDMKKKIEELSTGNKKKCSIIQAFAHSPKLLILDEPTSGLDPLMQSILFELIEEENSRGTTVFFSSHVLSDVQKICDRVAIIRKGKIIKIETIDELRKNMFKRVTLTFKDKSQINRFEIDNCLNPRIKNDKLTFNYTAGINELLKNLCGFDIDNLSIEDATLDDIFMRYYNDREYENDK